MVANHASTNLVAYTHAWLHVYPSIEMVTEKNTLFLWNKIDSLSVNWCGQPIYKSCKLRNDSKVMQNSPKQLIYTTTKQ